VRANRLNRSRSLLPAELLGTRPRCHAEGLPAVRVVEQQSNTLAERNAVGNQVTRFAIDDRLLQATIAPRDDRHTRRHCFQRRHAEFLTVRREHRHRCGAIRIGELTTR
jgi:hypothetical protein